MGRRANVDFDEAFTAALNHIFSPISQAQMNTQSKNIRTVTVCVHFQPCYSYLEFKLYERMEVFNE
jgi:hypothetical protein